MDPITSADRLVKTIMSILDGDVDAPFETVKAVNERLVNEIAAIRERLESCCRLLDNGHRTEALELSGLEPELLESCRIIDFDDWWDWVEFVRDRDIDAPEKLSGQLIETLSNAFFAEQSVEKLLAKHRVAALGRFALLYRMRILRELAEKDKGNPAWICDLRSYERERVLQLKEACRSALEQRDVALLESILNEVRDDSWIERPPSSLVKQVKKSYSHVAAVLAREKLAGLAASLNSAFAEMDADGGREVARKWRSTVRIARLEMGHPLHEVVAPVLEWLDELDNRKLEEDSHRNLVAELEMRLDENADQEVLENLWNALSRTEHEVPGRLERRYRDRLVLLEHRTRRKFLLLVGTSLAIVVLTGLLIGFFYTNKNRTAEIASHVEVMDRLIKERDFEAAEDYWDSLRKVAWLNASPLMRAKLADLSRAIRNDEQRASRFRALLESLSLRLDSDWEDIDDASDALEEARSLALSPGELGDLANRESEIDSIRNQLQHLTNTQFSNTIQAIRDDLVGVDDLSSISGLKHRLDDLRRLPRVSESLKPVIQTIDAAIEAKREMIVKNRELVEALEAIDHSVGDVDKFVSALTDYANEHGGQRAESFVRIIENESEHWRSVALWNQFAMRCKTKSVNEVDSGTAVEMAKTVERIRQSETSVDAPDEIKAWYEFCVSVQNRSLRNGESRLVALGEIIKQSCRRVRYVVLSKDGKRYYPAEKPTLLGVKWVFSAYKDKGFSATRRMSVDIENIANKRLGDDYDWESSEFKFALDVERQMNEPGLNWERFFSGIIQDLAGYNQIDPIRRIQLFKQIITIAAEGSLPIRSVLSKQIAILQALDELSPSLNWLDYGSEGDISLTRARCIRTLDRLELMHGLSEKIADQLMQLPIVTSESQREWIGWLYSDDEITFRGKRQFQENDQGRLIVFKLPNTQIGNRIFEELEIGSVVDGKVSLLPSGKSMVDAEGRAVFFSKKANPLGN